MVKNNSFIVLFLSIVSLLSSCSFNDGYLLDELEVNTKLSQAQYDFLDSANVFNLTIDENEIIRGIYSENNSDRPHYYFESDISFENVRKIQIPFRIYGIIKPTSYYSNLDTIVLIERDGPRITFHKSVNFQPFEVIKELNLKPSSQERYSVSNISMKNSNVGYFFYGRTFYDGNNGDDTIPNVELLQYNNGTLTEISTNHDHLFGDIHSLPSGALMKAEYLERRYDLVYKILVSKSFDHGITWISDSINVDWNVNRYEVERQQGLEVLNDNVFINNEGIFKFYSFDAVNWNQTLIAGNDRAYCLQFLNTNDGFASVPINNTVDLFATNDGGVSWYKANLNEEKQLSQFYFANPKLGISFSSIAIQITRDGGATWELISHNTFGLFKP